MKKELLEKANKYIEFLDYEEFEERCKTTMDFAESNGYEYSEKEIRDKILASMIEELENNMNTSESDPSAIENNMPESEFNDITDDKIDESFEHDFDEKPNIEEYIPTESTADKFDINEDFADFSEIDKENSMTEEEVISINDFEDDVEFSEEDIPLTKDEPFEDVNDSDEEYTFYDAEDEDISVDKKKHATESVKKGAAAVASRAKIAFHGFKELRHKKKENDHKKEAGKEVFSFADLMMTIFPWALVALALTVIFSTVLQIGKIPSGSMTPTVCEGDVCIYNRLANTDELECGDIVSFYSQEEDCFMIKRIIGVGGDTISFQDGYVYVNGELLDESEYIDDGVLTYCNETFTVPDGYYFMLGDNRMESNDSRFWEYPFINADNIYGKLLLTIPLHVFTGGETQPTTVSGDALTSE